jgi:hypothetical protein
MSNMHRRGFLATTAAAIGGLAMPPYARAFAEGQPSVPHPCPSNAWEKRGVVLDDTDGPIQNFTSPAEPLEGDRWRLWYTERPTPTKVSKIGVAEGRPGEKMRKTPAVVSAGDPPDAPLSIGNLPEGWHPVQPVHLRLNNGRHRLYFWAHGPKVVRYLIAESDDGKKYKVLDPARPCLYHPADRAVDGRTAAEAGISRMAKKIAVRPAGEPAAAALQVSNDATNVYQLADGTFEMYSVGLVEVPKEHPGYIAHDNTPGWLRVIDYYRSEDGLRFTERRRVIVADGQDPADMQFYYLAVTHTPQGRVGMLGHYRVEAQTMDLEWCFSTDGVQWQRPSRQPWIPRGNPGESDCYGIFAPHALVFHQNRWHLFYTAFNAAHNKKHSYGPPTQVVMHAVCDLAWS